MRRIPDPPARDYACTLTLMHGGPVDYGPAREKTAQQVARPPRSQTNHDPMIAGTELQACIPSRSTAACAAWVRGLVLLLGCGTSFAGLALECTAPASTTKPLLDRELPIVGRNTQTTSLMLPASGTYVIYATERGIDTQLEVRALSQSQSLIVDDPVRRRGHERVVVATSGGMLAIAIRGKENDDVRGSVRIVVTDAPEARCLELARVLTEAQSYYAVGERVTLALAATPGANASGLDAPRMNAQDAYARAVGALGRAVARAATLADPQSLADAEHSLAAAQYQGTREYAATYRTASDARHHYETAHDEYGSMRARGLAASALLEIALGRGSGALTASLPEVTSEQFALVRSELDSIAEFHVARGERYEAALARNNAGLSYYYESRYDDAIGEFERALALYRQIGDVYREAQTGQNIGLALSDSGNYSTALERYDQMLARLPAERFQRLYADILVNRGLALANTGSPDGALRDHGRAYEIFRRLQLPRDQARALTAIASVYYGLGDQALARDFAEQALRIQTVDLDPRARASTLRTLASIHRDLANPERALSLHREALERATGIRLRSRLLIEIARDQILLGQREAARVSLETLVGSTDAPAVDHELARVELARIDASEQHYAAARTSLERALAGFVQLNYTEGQVAAMTELAQIARDTNDDDRALDWLERALVLAEQLRLQTVNPELRGNLGRSLRPIVDRKIDLLMKRYDAALARRDRASAAMIARTALETSERARARVLAEIGQIAMPSDPDVAALLVQREALYRALAERSHRLEVLQANGTTDSRVEVLREDLARLRNRLDVLSSQLLVAGRREPELLASGRIDARTLREWPADVAAVEYWLGEKTASVWVVTREGIEWLRLGATLRIDRAALDFYQAIQHRDLSLATRLARAEALHALIIEPLAALIAGKRQLVFLPDERLHYIPFATLRGTRTPAGEYLVSTYEIANAPSLRALLQAPPPDQLKGQMNARALVIADPVFDPKDSRMRRTTVNADAADEITRSPVAPPDASQAEILPRLPGTRREATAIAAALAPRVSVLQLEGFDATRDAFLNADFAQYRFIHIATHGQLDGRIPQLSALVFSTYGRDGVATEGRVWAGDLMAKRFARSVVVLSACDTALGRELPGEGLLGLQSVILARGAESVIASLWRAPDSATEKLMAGFYAAVRDGASAQSALARAMRAMLATRGTADPIDWASFTLSTVSLRATNAPTAMEVALTTE
jgi:CHAT domain-containing protein